jgi:hypothetical protein
VHKKGVGGSAAEGRAPVAPRWARSNHASEHLFQVRTHWREGNAFSRQQLVLVPKTRGSKWHHTRNTRDLNPGKQSKKCRCIDGRTLQVARDRVIMSFSTRHSSRSTRPNPLAYKKAGNNKCTLTSLPQAGPRTNGEGRSDEHTPGPSSPAFLPRIPDVD